MSRDERDDFAHGTSAHAASQASARFSAEKTACRVLTVAKARLPRANNSAHQQRTRHWGNTTRRAARPAAAMPPASPGVGRCSPTAGDSRREPGRSRALRESGGTNQLLAHGQQVVDMPCSGTCTGGTRCQRASPRIRSTGSDHPATARRVTACVARPAGECFAGTGTRLLNPGQPAGRDFECSPAPQPKRHDRAPRPLRPCASAGTFGHGRFRHCRTGNHSPRAASALAPGELSGVKEWHSSILIR
jgi:hypothetical protein